MTRDLAVATHFAATRALRRLTARQQRFRSPTCFPAATTRMAGTGVETLANVGYGTMAPATLYGHAVSAIEIVCGMVFTAIMTGLLFVHFSKSKPKILFADQAIVTSHNGSPALMVRIANGRMTLLTNATVQLGVLLKARKAIRCAVCTTSCCRTRVSLCSR